MYEQKADCKEKRHQDIDFSCLYVDIPKVQGKITLEDSLNHLKVEQVPLPCEYCKFGLKAVKELKVEKYPRCLMVMIKRFDKLEKNSRMVHYPTEFKGMNLKAVIEHHGKTIASGHYKAKCWNQATQKWYVMDDHFVKEIGEPRIHTAEAYMLLYVNDGMDVIPKTPEPCPVSTPTEENEGSKPEQTASTERESNERKRNVKI